MNIDIAIPACLPLISGHKEFLIQILIQFIKNQAPFGGHQCTVRIGIAFISDITNRLAFGINIIHHVDKVHFIIPIITITLCHIRVHFFQSTFHNIMHLCNRDTLLLHTFCSFRRISAKFCCLFFRKCIQGSCSRLIHRTDNLLHIKFFTGSIFFDYIHRFHLLFECRS